MDTILNHDLAVRSGSHRGQLVRVLTSMLVYILYSFHDVYPPAEAKNFIDCGKKPKVFEGKLFEEPSNTYLAC